MSIRARGSFVVTVSTFLVGCPESKPPVTVDPPPVFTATADGPEPEPEPAAKRKRKVRDLPPKMVPLDGATLGDAKQLNPRDGQSRVIRALMDGSCYVHVPPPPGTPIGPPGTELPREVVDCPPEMDDPAWDTCFHGTLNALQEGGCACFVGGNPPPPPFEAECPEGAAQDE